MPLQTRVRCLSLWLLRAVVTLQIIIAVREIPANSEERNATQKTGNYAEIQVSTPQGTIIISPTTKIQSLPKTSKMGQHGPKLQTTERINASTKHCNMSNGTPCTSKPDRPIRKREPSKLPYELTIDEILLICGFVFTFIVGVFGNAFVCYVFGYQRQKHRSVTETLILYLGVVDLLASIVNPLLFTYWTITRYSRWDFGEIGCKILVPLAPITITISATIIRIVCLDRYRAIVSPFRGRYSKTQINVFVGIAVVVSILSYTSYVINLEVMPGRTCLVPRITKVGFAVPYIVITLVRDIGYTILFCFTSVVIFQRLQVDEMLPMNTQYLQQRRKDSSRICRILFCVGVVFALLVFPKDALSLASTISWMSPPGIGHSKAILYLNGWLKVLNVSNSCVNVFIYSHMHARFKKELCNLFRKCFRRRSALNGGPNTIVTDDYYDDSGIKDYDGKEGEMWLRNRDGIEDVRIVRGNSENEKKANAVKFHANPNGFQEAETLIR